MIQGIPPISGSKISLEVGSTAHFFPVFTHLPGQRNKEPQSCWLDKPRTKGLPSELFELLPHNQETDSQGWAKENELSSLFLEVRYLSARSRSVPSRWAEGCPLKACTLYICLSAVVGGKSLFSIKEKRLLFQVAQNYQSAMEAKGRGRLKSILSPSHIQSLIYPSAHTF